MSYVEKTLKALRSYRKISDWNHFAKEFDEVYEGAKELGNNEVEQVRELSDRYFSRVKDEVNKDDLNEEELEAFTKLEEVMNKIKYDK
jgi:hypothetical protein|nr:MAG TPA: hypothetical protein [Caudoviricetes sp.]